MKSIEKFWLIKVFIAEMEGTGLVCGPGASFLVGEGERAPELGLCPEPGHGGP